MGADSKIEWTHHTLNPWIGCAKVSPGCAHCYAAVNTFTRAQRAHGRELWGPTAARHVVSEAKWREPLRWDRAAAKAGERHRVFCASMADVFEARDDLHEPRSRLFSLILATPHLDWLLLTKRPENVEIIAPESWMDGFPKNVWLGTTVEDQERADERIPHLLAVPAAVRFLSVEPLLGPVEIGPYLPHGCRGCNHPGNLLPAWNEHGRCSECDGTGQEPAIDWVIVGGESGPGARPMHPSWAVSVVEQCREAGIPCFFKQAGSVLARQMGFQDAKGGDMNEWPSAWRVREFPRGAREVGSA